MAVFNQCSHLVNSESVEKVRVALADYTRNGRNPLQLVLDTQLRLQQELAKRLPQNGNVDPSTLKTCGELVDYTREQFDSIIDESRELLTSFGGMSTSEKSATSVWKKWKSDNQSKRAVVFNEMGQDDKLEVYMEYIDILHFVFNIGNSLGLSADDILELYLLKNAENLNRYQNSY
jgi:hypothetical protein